MSSVEDARYMFVKVNEHLKSRGNFSVFNIKLVGLTPSVRLENGLYAIVVDDIISNISAPDLIIIPSLNGDMITPLSLNLNFNQYLVRFYNQGTEIASLCTGSFMLATTGLLKNSICSTHWHYANEFRNFFGDIQMVDDRVITERNGLYTSGGATSYWNLLLHLVEKYTDKETAVWVSKYFALDVKRTSQSPFSIFNGQKNHSDSIVLKVQEYIESNYAGRLIIDELASQFKVGRRNLERRFRTATHNSILEYIQRVRIEAAKKGLESRDKNVNDVMYDVGYVNANAFRTAFKKITTILPLEYKNRYCMKY
jgi:transcriptional regulator GlxA family with amidase domain